MVSAWTNADQHRLFWESNRLKQLLDLKAVVTTETERERNLREASRLYASDIAIVDGAEVGRTNGMVEHRKHVCQLAQK